MHGPEGGSFYTNTEGQESSESQRDGECELCIDVPLLALIGLIRVRRLVLRDKKESRHARYTCCHSLGRMPFNQVRVEVDSTDVVCRRDDVAAI